MNCVYIWDRVYDDVELRTNWQKLVARCSSCWHNKWNLVHYWPESSYKPSTAIHPQLTQVSNYMVLLHVWCAVGVLFGMEPMGDQWVDMSFGLTSFGGTYRSKIIHLFDSLLYLFNKFVHVCPIPSSLSWHGFATINGHQTPASTINKMQQMSMQMMVGRRSVQPPCIPSSRYQERPHCDRPSDIWFQ